MNDELLLLALVALMSPPERRRTNITPAKKAGPPREPPPVAYIYQLPNQTEFRMAVQRDGGRPREMGIFGSVAMAEKVARSKGWRLAWSGYRDLDVAPG